MTCNEEFSLWRDAPHVLSTYILLVNKGFWRSAKIPQSQRSYIHCQSDFHCFPAFPSMPILMASMPCNTTGAGCSPDLCNSNASHVLSHCRMHHSKMVKWSQMSSNGSESHRVSASCFFEIFLCHPVVFRHFIRHCTVRSSGSQSSCWA